MGRPFLEKGFPGTAAPFGTDVLIALFPPAYHLGNEFRRILQIGIHDDGRITGQIIDACRHGDFLAKITGQIDVRHAVILLPQFVHNRKRPILTAVIDKHKLEIIGRNPIDDGCRAAIKLVQHSLFIITRHQNRNQLPSLSSLHFIHFLSHFLRPFLI